MRILSFSLHSGIGQPSHSQKQQLMSAYKVCDFATNKSPSILSLQCCKRDVMIAYKQIDSNVQK